MSQDGIIDETPQPDEPEAAAPEIDDDPVLAAVEINGQKLVPVDAVIGERQRGRKRTERVEAELAPLREKAGKVDQLEAQIAELSRRLQPKPEPPKGPDITVTDEEAMIEAKESELYDPTTQQLNIPLARKRLERQRRQAMELAEKIADKRVKEIIGPMQQKSAIDSSKDNFLSVASERDADGQAYPREFLTILARKFGEMGPELTQHPEVAQTLRDAAYGEFMRTSKRAPKDDRSPVFSEAPGGGNRQSYSISQMERSIAGNVGMKQDDWAKSAQRYNPTKPMVLGEK